MAPPPATGLSFMSHQITDNELLTKFSKAQALKEENRKYVKHVLKAFLFQKDMQKQLA
jgi:hypothetical protein